MINGHGKPKRRSRRVDRCVALPVSGIGSCADAACVRLDASYNWQPAGSPKAAVGLTWMAKGWWDTLQAQCGWPERWSSWLRSRCCRLCLWWDHTLERTACSRDNLHNMHACMQGVGWCQKPRRQSCMWPAQANPLAHRGKQTETPWAATADLALDTRGFCPPWFSVESWRATGRADAAARSSGSSSATADAKRTQERAMLRTCDAAEEQVLHRTRERGRLRMSGVQSAASAYAARNGGWLLHVGTPAPPASDVPAGTGVMLNTFQGQGNYMPQGQQRRCLGKRPQSLVTSAQLPQ